MTDLYEGHDPRSLPAYPVPEAAHYLRIPPSTLRSWVSGRHYPLAGGTGRFEPLIRLPDPRIPSLSFTNLVEAHVLAAVRRDHKVTLDKVRKAIAYVQERLGVEHPLAHVDFETNGVDLFVEEMGHLVVASKGGQTAMREVLHAFLRRIDRDEEGLAARLFPFTRSGNADQPKLIVIDPRLAFGRPVVAGTGVPVEVLRERFRAGESLDDLAADYRCDRVRIEEAIRCVVRDAA